MNSKAMTSFIVGIMSIFIPLLGLILGIFGIVYANQAMKQIELTGQDGRTYALAGKICSSIGLALQIILLLFVLASLLFFSSFTYFMMP
ncbi:DUF4190 domain-containing protein [Halobacillus fulvus]|nr:DUF4190 domain-containing protein [Halobacillus fulvus]